MGAEPWNWSAFGRGEFPGTSFGTSSNYSETSGVKSGSARSPKGGGKGGGKRQLGCRLARHPPRLVARVNRSISMLFYRNSTASFSNPPLVPFDPKSWLIFRAALSNGSRSKIGTREREREERRLDRLLLHASTYIFLLAYTDRYTDIVPSRGHSFSTKASSAVLAFTYLESEPWKTGARTLRKTSAERDCEA